MSRIFWDTNLFVYLIEGRGPRTDAVSRLRKRMIERRDELFVSSLTFGEILVRPLEAGNAALAARYEDAIASAATVIPFDVEAARRFAAIRRDRTIRPPDAIQLACAARVGVDLFLTNDDRLSAKTVPGIEFVTSLDRAPL